MKHRLLTAMLPIALCVPLAMPAAADPSKMQPGLWEITSEVDMPGMPMKLPPQTMQHCYTAADLEQGKNAVPQSQQSNCKVTDYKIDGNTATWEMECTGPTPMHGTGTMTTDATSYSGSMHSVMQGPNGNTEMTTHWHAKRIGACQ
jgi:hypothetical protein